MKAPRVNVETEAAVCCVLKSMDHRHRWPASDLVGIGIEAAPLRSILIETSTHSSHIPDQRRHWQRSRSHAVECIQRDAHIFLCSGDSTTVHKTLLFSIHRYFHRNPAHLCAAQ
jgi:hypothetical protein